MTPTYESGLSESTSMTSKQRTEAKSDSGSEKVDPNIQFVEVQTLLFGDTPNANPKTIFLKNHEPTKAS